MQGPARGEQPGSGSPGSPGARRARRGGWGTAAALAAAVLLLGVVEGFALLALPLAVLLMGLAPRRRRWWFVVGALVCALAIASAGGALGNLSRGWGLLVGGLFLAMTLVRPRWGVFSRALASVALALGLVGGGLLIEGAWPRVDAAIAEHFRSVAALSSREFLGRFPDARWATELAGMSERMAATQSRMFPALLALQTLAALVLAWWAFVRTRPGGARSLAPGPLREFRFNDSLVWLAIAGLVLVVLPVGDGVLLRAGYNILAFMAVLYALRGLAVFVFLARGAPTATSVVLGAVATLLFYPLVFTAALLVGLGDTWLDVRGRAVAASQA